MMYIFTRMIFLLHIYMFKFCLQISLGKKNSLAILQMDLSLCVCGGAFFVQIVNIFALLYECIPVVRNFSRITIVC